MSVKPPGFLVLKPPVEAGQQIPIAQNLDGFNEALELIDTQKNAFNFAPVRYGERRVFLSDPPQESGKMSFGFAQWQGVRVIDHGSLQQVCFQTIILVTYNLDTYTSIVKKFWGFDSTQGDEREACFFSRGDA